MFLIFNDIFIFLYRTQVNVDSASTMQVVNALIKAHKDFEPVVIPRAHHTMGEDFGEHKRYDFFVRHLMDVNPPKWDVIK